ncbi:hypothetical protein [Salipiger bermudensis]|uniref:Lipoprotein n=1 Tax=Salipiger bermudensis (strain DSM 26914 / JCM 13377 / KCTC 12554 / HTCC2601) TaxID=314265 RepID=Q0FKJ5_SALBH|nr:hypothetical protein [Salipiger bermudensis]EAU44737.1 hypothetical protein R2601_07723 [Salipiger bermudensis HTCC2601]MBN9674669.1 hypothetical protein [Salipiger bermudensis]
MTKTFRLTAALTALALLAGCVEDSGSVTSAPMEASPAGPPFITTFDGSVSNEAISACRAELESMTEGVVTAVGSEFSEAATAVYLRVGANGAPWRCLVSSDGSNPSVMFMGDEGAL